MTQWLQGADDADRALYAAIADAPTPRLDAAMRMLSAAANYSRLSIACAALLALTGPRGRRAARDGLLAAFSAAAIVNALLKPFIPRERPDRAGARVPTARHVAMPTSNSFPSGHTAAAVAFAVGAGREMGEARLPLGALAVAVGYSRVHTGVHYPGDVFAGAALGAGIAQLTARLSRRLGSTLRPKQQPV